MKMSKIISVVGMGLVGTTLLAGCGSFGQKAAEVSYITQASHVRSQVVTDANVFGTISQQLTEKKITLRQAAVQAKTAYTNVHTDVQNFAAIKAPSNPAFQSYQKQESEDLDAFDSGLKDLTDGLNAESASLIISGQKKLTAVAPKLTQDDKTFQSLESQVSSK